MEHLGPESVETRTRPRVPGNAREYRTCGGDGSVHGAVPSGSLQRFGSVHGGSVRFQNPPGYGYPVPSPD